jgi:Na+/H+ antiporter NhaA
MARQHPTPFVVAKPLGIVIASRAASRGALLSLTRDELRGTAFSAGIGFTVSLLIASRAFDGALLDQAKVGILATALLAPALAAAALAPLRRRARGASVRHYHGAPLISPCPAR